jgi:hypothetical protein
MTECTVQGKFTRLSFKHLILNFSKYISTQNPNSLLYPCRKRQLLQDQRSIL